MDLYPYQQEGAQFLSERKRALLADTMGLGKTAQAIHAAGTVKAESILIICPAGVRINWLREYKRFALLELQCSVIQTAKDHILAAGVNIISYELAATPKIHQKLMKMQFDVLILDESHFLKSRVAKRTEAIYGVHCKGETGLISRATHVWALTGTPTPNNPAEIYSLLRAFKTWNQNYFAFQEKFCVVEEGVYGTRIVGIKNTKELKALVNPIMLRRKVEEVMKDLPPVTLSDIALSAYGVSRPEEIADWLEAEDRREGKILRSRLEAAADETDLDLSTIRLPTLRRLTGMAKVRPVCELVMRELDSGLDKIVIYGEHRDVLESVRQVLQKYGAVIVYGGTPADVKQERIEKFIHIWKHRVMIGHIKTLGTGIDGLQTVCNNGLFIESSWNPAENAQAIGRLRRNGQTRPVFIRFASLADSLDEHVQRVIRRKTAMIKQLLD